MKLSIENFGAIKKRITLEPKPLTIFCGENNTGKTYALYVLNALMDSRFVANFDFSKKHAHALFTTKTLVVSQSDWLGATALQRVQSNLSESLKSALQRFFVTDADLLKDANFEISVDAQRTVEKLNPDSKATVSKNLRFGGVEDSPNATSINCKFTESSQEILFTLKGEFESQKEVESALNRCLMRLYLPEQKGRDFLLPAERSGINLFFRELNSRRAALLRHVTSQTLDTAELLKDIIVSRYPQPIHDYIEFMNSQPEIKREVSEFADLAEWLQKTVLKVKYKVDRYGDISVAPLRSGTTVGLHLGSSTVKTFFGLWSYLNHMARPGDWLMIDEPELNLHPQNQLAIARLLAQLVNRGISVVVSTHSDYMVRQWSNLLMLGACDFDGRDDLAKQYDLPKEQWLKPEQIVAYEFSVGKAVSMDVNAESGIRTALFDVSITQLNTAAQDIYLNRQAAFNDEPSEDAASVQTKTKAVRKNA